MLWSSITLAVPHSAPTGIAVISSPFPDDSLAEFLRAQQKPGRAAHLALSSLASALRSRGRPLIPYEAGNIPAAMTFTDGQFGAHSAPTISGVHSVLDLARSCDIIR
jgi:hypothetical protein